MQLLIDPGDTSAEPGSRRWCLGVLAEASVSKNDTQSAVRNLKVWLRMLRRDDNFTKLADAEDRAFLSWEDFVQYREPFGLGMRVDVVNAILAERDESRLLSEVVADVPALAKHGEVGNGRSRGDNITSTDRGTSASYLAARLKRDAPEIAARIDEFPSMRAAALAAGIVRDRTPLQITRSAWNRATQEQREEIAAWVDEQMSPVRRTSLRRVV